MAWFQVDCCRGLSFWLALGDYLSIKHPTMDVGHMIGVECHEETWLHPVDKVEFQNGMTFCMEPKIWFKGEYNLRIEDLMRYGTGKLSR